MIGDKYIKKWLALSERSESKGFTLIELMVSMAVFVLVVSTVSGLFASSLKLQRNGIAYQQLLDQTSYLAEYMSRAIRMAKKDLSGVCTDDIAKVNYAFSGQCLKFRNYKDQCQQFCLDGSRIKDENGLYLTSSDLRVLSFTVDLSGQTQNDDLQPKAVMSLDIQGKESSRITIQTSISQRNLDIRR